MKGKRFGISGGIDLEKLEHESRDLLFMGLALAIIIHVVLFAVLTGGRNRHKTITFVPVELEIRRKIIQQPPTFKRPAFRKRTYERMTPPEAQVHAPKELGEKDRSISLKEYKAHIDAEQKPYEEMIDETLARNERNRPAPEERVPLPGNVVKDDGTLPARVVVNPLNKKAIEGYARLCYAWRYGYDPPESFRNPVENLARALTGLTNIKARAVIEKEGRTRLPRYPLMYIPAEDFIVIEHPGRFTNACEFFVIDAGGSGNYSKEVLETKLNDVLYSLYGWELSLRPLPANHALFHCFYDFDRPPEGSLAAQPNVITGIFSGDHLIGIYCPQGYGGAWLDDDSEPKNENALRFGVNMAVYSLAPGKWLDNDRRMTFNDIATHEFTMWYDNGKARFRGGQSGQARWMSNGSRKYSVGSIGVTHTDKVWLPEYALKVSRIVTETVNYNGPGAPFNPDLVIASYYFNYNTEFNFIEARIYPELGKLLSNIGAMDLIPWGVYNSYEGWHDNGLRMYYYNYNDRWYTEWDTQGNILSEGDDNEHNKAPEKELTAKPASGGRIR